MANVSIKFNNKDYLLSCDEGQEESLKKLTSFLDKKYNELKDQLGSIGENKLLLITTIKIVDDYFNLKQKVDSQKNKLSEISKKFLEMKSLAIQYKENKDKEVNNLNTEIDKLRIKIEESNSLYESILDKTTKSLQDIVNNTESKSELQ
jgi:cell division protein ZapA|tara:strand:+ start:312 stop:758 length:447 start_codon:yes stop_codon:yes gene_type:complete